MKANWRLTIKRISLVVSIVALLAGIGLYIVQRQWNLYLQICLGLFVVGLAVYVIADPDAIRKLLTGRHAKYGSNAFILLVAFLGILIVINYLVFNNDKKWDLSADQSNTLAKETVDVLKSLPENITAKAFFTTNASVASSKQNAQDLLDKYVYDGGGKFQYEFIDPNKDPVAAQDAGITNDGSIVLYMGNAKQPVSSITESDITGAMVRLMNPTQHVIYFLTGHGEFSIDASGNQSYSKLKTALEAKNYTVSSLNLLTTGSIPKDASVIVIPGPMKPLSDAEISLLDEYLKNGGSLVVMEEPTIVTQYGDNVDPLADYLSKTYGIVLGNDIIVDLQAAQQFQQPYVAIADQYAQNTITQKMNGLVTVFPTARSVTSSASVGSDLTKTELIKTSSQSWAETDMASVSNNTVKPDQGVDTYGPVSIAVTAEDPSTAARLVVFGDSDFASDGSYDAYGNGEMIVNSIDWAAKEENLISLTAKTTTQRSFVPISASTRNLIFLGVIFVLPGIVLVAGVGTWVYRRRQG
jgi:ABC-type uncharacterized transport system involved in gliding motility auxiliary subunit